MRCTTPVAHHRRRRLASPPAGQQGGDRAPATAWRGRRSRVQDLRDECARSTVRTWRTVREPIREATSQSHTRWTCLTSSTAGDHRAVTRSCARPSGAAARRPLPRPASWPSAGGLAHDGHRRLRPADRRGVPRRPRRRRHVRQRRRRRSPPPAAGRPGGRAAAAAGVVDGPHAVPGVARAIDYDFRCGLPDVARFPFDIVASAASARQLRPGGVGRVQYGEPAGHPALRAAIARHLGVSRPCRASADDIVVTNGIQQAIDLVARVLLAPGDRVAVEDPGYPPARSLLAHAGPRRRRRAGRRRGHRRRCHPGRRPRAVLVTPSHQFPLGHTMSLRRRVALLRWAEGHDAAIIEDDYDSEFRFGGRPIEPLQSLDTQRPRALHRARSPRRCCRRCGSGSSSRRRRCGRRCTPPSTSPTGRRRRRSSWPSPSSSTAAGSPATCGRCAPLYRERHRARSRRSSTSEFAGVLQEVPSAAGLHLSARRRRRCAPTSARRSSTPRAGRRRRRLLAGLVRPCSSRASAGVVHRLRRRPARRHPRRPRAPARRLRLTVALPHFAAPRMVVRGCEATTAGQTFDVRSAQNGARSSRLRILPEPVLGSSSSHEIDRGTL